MSSINSHLCPRCLHNNILFMVCLIGAYTHSTTMTSNSSAEYNRFFCSTSTKFQTKEDKRKYDEHQTWRRSEWEKRRQIMKEKKLFLCWLAGSSVCFHGWIYNLVDSLNGVLWIESNASWAHTNAPVVQKESRERRGSEKVWGWVARTNTKNFLHEWQQATPHQALSHMHLSMKTGMCTENPIWFVHSRRKKVAEEWNCRQHQWTNRRWAHKALPLLRCWFLFALCCCCQLLAATNERNRKFSTPFNTQPEWSAVHIDFT